MPETKLTSHLTPQTSLPSAINSWHAYLADKGRSPNTIKAFLSDVRLLTTFLPEDVAIGKISTQDLNRYFEWMEKERDVPCSPKTLARRITATKSLFRWLHHNLRRLETTVAETGTSEKALLFPPWRTVVVSS